MEDTTMKTRFRSVTICAALLLGAAACSSSSNNNDGGASGGRGGAGGIKGTGGRAGGGGAAGGGAAHGGNGGGTGAVGGAGGVKGTGGNAGNGGNRANGGNGGTAGNGGNGGNRANGGNGGTAGNGGNGGNGPAGNGGAGGTAGGAGNGGNGGAMATLTNPQVAGVAIAANQGEVQEAQLAQSKSVNPAVLDFAMTMITDHNAAVMRLQQVLDNANLMTADSPQRMSLSDSATMTYNQLFGLSGSAFDRAYAMSQVTAHQTVLNLFDQTLIPSATNANLKAELQTERMAVTMHLTAAQTLVSTLATDGGADH
jgi:predicted outer membrane protein